MSLAELALKLRPIIEKAMESVDDKTASDAPMLFPHLKENGELVRAGVRINWKGVVKKAAVDLWDTVENNPDNAPTLWEDLPYRDGYRIIPETITVTGAFYKGELGWWDNILYRSMVNGNVYNPSQYSGNWEKV